MKTCSGPCSATGRVSSASANEDRGRRPSDVTWCEVNTTDCTVLVNSNHLRDFYQTKTTNRHGTQESTAHFLPPAHLRSNLHSRTSRTCRLRTEMASRQSLFCVLCVDGRTHLLFTGLEEKNPGFVLLGSVLVDTLTSTDMCADPNPIRCKYDRRCGVCPPGYAVVWFICRVPSDPFRGLVPAP